MESDEKLVWSIRLIGKSKSIGNLVANNIQIPNAIRYGIDIMLSSFEVDEEIEIEAKGTLRYGELDLSIKFHRPPALKP